MLLAAGLLLAMGFGGGPAWGQVPAREVPSTPAESDPSTVEVTRYVSYTSYGQPEEKKNALGETTTMNYEGPDNRLSKVEMPHLGGGLTVTYDYNSRGLLSQITNEAGGTKSFSYDGLGRLSRVENDAGEPVTTYDYNYNADPSSWDFPGEPNNVKTRQVGGAKSPDVTRREVVDGLGRNWQKVTQLTSRRILVQATLYDAQGRTRYSSRPYVKERCSQCPDIQHDESPSVADNPGTVTTYEASPLDRPSTIDPPGPGDVGKGYGLQTDPFSGAHALSGTYRVEETVDESGDQKRIYTDGFGRTVAVVADPGGTHAVTRFEYDAAGNLTKVIKPKGDEVHYEYDRRGRQTKRKSPDAGTTKRLYDAGGNARFVQDAAQAKQGTVQYTCVDGAGRPLESGVAALSEFGVGSFEELDPEVLASGDGSAGDCAVAETWRKTVQAYDQAPSSGRSPWDSWSGWSGLSLDSTKGKLAARARKVKDTELVLGGDGSVEGPTIRSASSRIEASTSVEGEVTLTAGEEVRLKPGFSTEGGAILTATVDASKQSSTPDWRLVFYSYDADGRVKRKEIFAPGLGQVTLRYTYDRQGRVTRRKVELHRQGKTFYQWYDYNGRGLVEAVYASSSSGKPSTPEVSYTYELDGQVKSADWKGGPTIHRGYNDRGWLSHIGDVGGPSGFAASYDYYADGNVREMTSDPEGRSSFTYKYGYDSLDRLKYADYGAADTGPYDSQPNYDKNGNLEWLTRYDSNGDVVDDLKYSYNANQLASISDQAGKEPKHGWDAGSGSFEYDAAGRMLEAPAPTGLVAAGYNEQGLPEAMALEGGTNLTYRYSAEGQRTYKQVEGSAATHYLRDGSVTLAVVEGGSLKRWNLTLPGGEVIGRYLYNEGSGQYTPHFYVKDHLGSVRGVLNDSGETVATRDYYPFGLRLPGRDQQAGTEVEEDFTGHGKDDATGLHYAGARYYSAAFARWTTTEPLLEEKGPKGLLKQDPRLLAWSPYNYTFNNPANLRDPTGKLACGGVCTAVVVGAAVGMAIEAGAQVAGDKIKGNSVSIDASDVAISGAIGGLTGGSGNALKAGRVAQVAIGALGGVAEGASKSAANGEGYSTLDAVIDAGAGLAGSTVLGKVKSALGGKLNSMSEEAAETLSKSLDSKSKLAKALAKMAESGSDVSKKQLRKLFKAASEMGQEASSASKLRSFIKRLKTAKVPQAAGATAGGTASSTTQSVFDEEENE